MAGQILAGNRRRERADGSGEKAPAIDDRRQFVIAHRIDRLAAIQRFERSEIVRMLLDGVGDLQKIAGSLGRGRARPAGKCCFRRVDGCIDLAVGGFGKVDDPGTGLRIEDMFLGFRSGFEL